MFSKSPSWPTLAPTLTLALVLGLVPAARAQRVVPASLSSSMTFLLPAGGTTLQAGRGSGARILSVKFEGIEQLHVDSSSGNLLWGSTLWASPQAHWTAACKSANNSGCWPPIAAHDANAYTGGINEADTAITFTGQADSYTRLLFRKSFSANLRDTSFTNRYVMVNTSTAPVTYAPWEDTRFPGGGLIFFPKGSEAATGTASMLAMTRDTLATTWFTYDSASFPSSGSSKIFADAGAPGWYAHVDRRRVLHIKKFTDTPPAKKAPGENEIEIYGTTNRTLVEMELQGAFNAIPANDSVVWEVKWYFRRLPENIAIGRNSALLDFVNRVISSGSTAARPEVLPAGSRLELAGRGLSLELPREALLSVALFNLEGRRIANLASGRLAAGRHDFALKALPGPCFIVVADLDAKNILHRRLVAGN